MAVSVSTPQEHLDKIKADYRAALGDSADVDSPRGNLTVMAKTEALVAADQDLAIQWYSRQILPDTASLENLERHGRLRGVYRKHAARAAGSVTFTGADGAVIPTGLGLRRGDDERFVVDAEAVIASGAAVVAVSAATAGYAANTAAGAALSLVGSLAGVQSLVTVTAGGISGGADEESDAAYRLRVLHRWQNPPQGGAEADYVAWALEVPGVTRAWCYRCYLGPGSVGVYFVRDDDPSGPIPNEAQKQEVRDHILPKVPSNCSADGLYVLGPAPVTLDFDLRLDADASETREAVEAGLADLVEDAAAPGVGLALNAIIGAIYTAVGGGAFALNSPSADVAVGQYEMLVLGAFDWGD